VPPAQEDIDEHQPQPTRNTFLALSHQFVVAALNLCAEKYRGGVGDVRCYCSASIRLPSFYKFFFSQKIMRACELHSNNQTKYRILSFCQISFHDDQTSVELH
jgi:hypothetical protein